LGRDAIETTTVSIDARSVVTSAPPVERLRIALRWTRGSPAIRRGAARLPGWRTRSPAISACKSAA